MQRNEDFICKCWMFSASLWLGVCWSRLIFLLWFACGYYHLSDRFLNFSSTLALRTDSSVVYCAVLFLLDIQYVIIKNTQHVHFFGKDKLFVCPYASKSFGQPNLGLRESIVQSNAHFSKWFVQLSAVDMDWVSSPFAMTSGGIFSVYSPLCFKNICTIFLLSL